MGYRSGLNPHSISSSGAIEVVVTDWKICPRAYQKRLLIINSNKFIFFSIYSVLLLNNHQYCNYFVKTRKVIFSKVEDKSHELSGGLFSTKFESKFNTYLEGLLFGRKKVLLCFTVQILFGIIEKVCEGWTY
jgi:hypothetical protein